MDCCLPLGQIKNKQTNKQIPCVNAQFSSSELSWQSLSKSHLQEIGIQRLLAQVNLSAGQSG